MDAWHINYIRRVHSMKNEITCIFQLEINEEKLSEFKSLVSKIVDATSKELGTRSYIYSVSKDEKTVHIVERYQKNALISHIKNTFSPFAEEFLSLVNIIGLTVYGEPDNDIRMQLNIFGPVYMKPFDGFTR